MPRPTLTLSQLAQDGPPVRVRDIVALTGLGYRTIARDVKEGQIRSTRPKQAGASPHLIRRDEARRYLTQLGVWHEQTRT